MAGFRRAVGLDLDRTITNRGTLSPSALPAVDDVRDDGLAAILVTGRVLVEQVAERDFDKPPDRRERDALAAKMRRMSAAAGADAAEDVNEPGFLHEFAGSPRWQGAWSRVGTRRDRRMRATT